MAPPRWLKLWIGEGFNPRIASRARVASGAYAVREADSHVVRYVGESSRGTLWKTILRHFQAPDSFAAVREAGIFTGDPRKYEIAIHVTSKGHRPRAPAAGSSESKRLRDLKRLGKRYTTEPDQRAMKAQADWIERLKPTINQDDGRAADLGAELREAQARLQAEDDADPLGLRRNPGGQSWPAVRTRILLGSTRSKDYLRRMKALGVGRLFAGEQPKPAKGEPWALDNGIFGAFKAGEPWDEQAFLSSLNAADRGVSSGKLSRPLFVVLPDRVADPRSLAFSLDWFDRVGRLYDLPWFLVLQDGMSVGDVSAALEKYPQIEGLFLGGSDAFKLSAPRWVELAHTLGRRFHFARVSTSARLREAAALGADSADTSQPLWSEELFAKFEADVRALGIGSPAGGEPFAIYSAGRVIVRELGKVARTEEERAAVSALENDAADARDVRLAASLLRYGGKPDLAAELDRLVGGPPLSGSAVLRLVDAGPSHSLARGSMPLEGLEAARYLVDSGDLAILPRKGRWPERYVVTREGSKSLGTFESDDRGFLADSRWIGEGLREKKAKAAAASGKPAGYGEVGKAGQVRMFNPARTFKQAHREILDQLEALEWQVKKSLKVPRATSRDGEVNVWFRPQAIYVGGRGATAGAARSSGIDARTMAPMTAIRQIDRMAVGGYVFEGAARPEPEFTAAQASRLRSGLAAQDREDMRHIEAERAAGLRPAHVPLAGVALEDARARTAAGAGVAEQAAAARWAAGLAAVEQARAAARRGEAQAASVAAYAARQWASVRPSAARLEKWDRIAAELAELERGAAVKPAGYGEIGKAGQVRMFNPPRRRSSAEALHAKRAGKLCKDDGSGSCGVCGVAMVACDACGGVGYHAKGCAESDARENPAPSSAALVELGRLTRLDVGPTLVLEWSVREAPTLAYDAAGRLVIAYRGPVVRCSSYAELRSYRRVHWGAKPRGKVRDCGTAPSPLRDLGAARAIVYSTRKGTDLQIVDYVHQFGEGSSGRCILPRVLEHMCQGGCAPTCAAAGSISLLGGSYRVTTRGIVG